ncbi:MAG TPA: PIN domain-containing protein [Thermoanaerobaculia bacterium]|nr:PIN domain-containing protein [Thermoanaerobaculia bacterium]
MILLDTSGLLAALFADQNQHEACAQVLRDAEPPFLLSPFILAETDYLIQKYGGIVAERLFLTEVVRGAYELVIFDKEDMRLAVGVVATYSDLQIGIADASLVALAERYECRDVLTLDLRHFRAMRPGRRRRFRISPADA